MGPDTPTLEEALRFFVDEAPALGVHLDLKLTKREADVIAAVRRLGLARRSFVSSYYFGTARAVAALDGDVRNGLRCPAASFGSPRRAGAHP